MKSLKSVFLLVLCSLFLLSACAGLQPSKPVITNPTVEEPVPDFYIKHNCWKSPFDPHKILKEWVNLVTKPIDSSMVMFVVGNPKIDWQIDYIPGTAFSDMPIPKGEITPAVVFIFAVLADKTVELVVFGYTDVYGIKCIYIWDEQQSCYRLEPTDGQDACSTNYFIT